MPDVIGTVIEHNTEAQRAVASLSERAKRHDSTRVAELQDASDGIAYRKEEVSVYLIPAIKGHDGVYLIQYGDDAATNPVSYNIEAVIRGLLERTSLVVTYYEPDAIDPDELSPRT